MPRQATSNRQNRRWSGSFVDQGRRRGRGTAAGGAWAAGARRCWRWGIARVRGSGSGCATRTVACGIVSKARSPCCTIWLSGLRASAWRRQNARPCGVSRAAPSHSQAASESGFPRSARDRSWRAVTLSPALAAAIPCARSEPLAVMDRTSSRAPSWNGQRDHLPLSKAFRITFQVRDGSWPLDPPPRTGAGSQPCAEC